MGFTIDGFNKTKSTMLAKFNKAFAAADALRKAGTDVPDKGQSADRVTVENKPETGEASLTEASRPL